VIVKKRGRPKGAKNKKTLTMLKQKEEGKVAKEVSGINDEISLVWKMEFPYLV
jgi:hypothetical protein